MKLKLSGRDEEKFLNKKIKTENNLSSNNLSKSYSSNKIQKAYEINNNKTIELNNKRNIYSATDFHKGKIFDSEKEEKSKYKYYKSNYNIINITPVMYDKKFELIKYRNLSLNNKLDKYLTNFLGIYNTKREKSHKKISEYKDWPKAKEQIKNNFNKQLIFSNYVKNKKITKPRVLSACISINNNRTKKNRKKDIISLIKYLDKSKKNEVYKI